MNPTYTSNLFGTTFVVVTHFIGCVLLKLFSTSELIIISEDGSMLSESAIIGNQADLKCVHTLEKTSLG